MKTFKKFIEEQSVMDELPPYDELDLRSQMAVDRGDYEGEDQSGDELDDDDFSDFEPKPKPDGGYTYTGNWLQDFYNVWMNSPSAWNPWG
tara:strand:- start:847 stop:1116 length:270 start_codon:yes stop_codon:yes gene_type:complete